MLKKPIFVTVVAISGLIPVPGHVLEALPGGLHDVRLVTVNFVDPQTNAHTRANIPVRGFRGLICSLEEMLTEDKHLIFEVNQGAYVQPFILSNEDRLLFPSDDLLNPWNGATPAHYPEWPAEGMLIKINPVTTD